MPKQAKIAFSLSQDLLQAIDTQRQAKGESRSAFLRRAVEAYLAQHRQPAPEASSMPNCAQYATTSIEDALAEAWVREILEEDGERQ